MYPAKAKLDVASRSKLFCGTLLICLLCLGVLNSAAHNPGNDPPYSDWPIVASIVDVGNNADESIEFTLQDCTAVRLLAVGEGSHWGMDDYGSIERTGTGQVIWQMHYFETELDGSMINRRVDRRLTLPAGEYRMRFRSNGSHAFDDWGRRPPAERFWGIALYQDTSTDQSPPDCWETAASPRELGWSLPHLERLTPELEKMNVAALMIVTDGQVVYESGNTANNFWAHSMRKSLISALYGIAADRGEIDTSLTLQELGIDDKTPLTEAEKRATVADLLKARSGVYIPAAGEAASMKASRPRRGSHAPGTFWYYNNWDFNTLGTIFDQETSQPNVYQAFQAWVADPIGTQDLDVERLSYSYEPYSVHPYYGFRISARDLARFGQLYLQNGSWQGRQVVPAEWVAESTRPHSRTNQDGTYSGYGYMWWIAARDHWSIPQGSYAASGYGGHTLEILPDLNTVIVVRINTDDPAVRLQNGRDIDRLVIEIIEASTRASIPHVQGEKLWMAWGVLVGASLALLLWSLVDDELVPWGIGLVWAIIVLVFGPVGALAYGLLVRRPARRGTTPPTWQRALGAALCGATGKITGLLLLLLTFALFIRSGNTGPLSLLAPFVVGWLGFRAPLLAFATGRSYWFAVRKSLLVEIVSIVLFAAGAAPVIAFLWSHWYPYTTDLSGPFFWALHTLAAFAGAGVVYPLYLWMAHRCLRVCPSQAMTEHPLTLPPLQSLFATKRQMEKS